MRKISLSLVALAALALSGVAAAQQSQAYVGLQAGTSRSNLDCTGAETCDKNGTGVKVYGGYKLTPQWAVELGYTDYGKVKASGTVSGTPVSGEVKTTGVGIGGAYHLSFNNDWSGVARLGLASNETKVSGTVGSASGSDSERKTKAYVGLGVGYALTKQVTLTGTWDNSEGEFNGESARYNVYSLGVNVAF